MTWSITDAEMKQWRTGLHAANPEQARALVAKVDAERKKWLDITNEYKPGWAQGLHALAIQLGWVEDKAFAGDYDPSTFLDAKMREVAALALRLLGERDVLFDALNLHMRSTGITNEAMEKVDAFRVLIEHSKEKVRGEFHRLEHGWNKAAKERDEARLEAEANLAAWKSAREAAEHVSDGFKRDAPILLKSVEDANRERNEARAALAATRAVLARARQDFAALLGGNTKAVDARLLAMDECLAKGDGDVVVDALTKAETVLARVVYLEQPEECLPAACDALKAVRGLGISGDS